MEFLDTPVLSADVQQWSFEAKLNEHNLFLRPLSLETLQVNITKLCNQACLHCHVDASPKRTEQMDERTARRVVEVLAHNSDIQKLDITGGAPELNPHFEFLVLEARKLGKHVMVRHNLTVQFDGNPQTGANMERLPEFFAAQGVEVISSLPYYQEFYTDKQRGLGVFKKSVEAIRRLNAVGYGQEGTGLELNLVYNPVGAFLPASQASLEAEYKRELRDKFSLAFNRLFTITNMPIHRFAESLKRRGGYEEYIDKLVNAFNPAAAESVMCRSLVSVGYDGRLYDCDFNQMLDLPIRTGLNGAARGTRTIFDFDASEILQRSILFDAHCYGCTAGAGSSCGGATA
jgi:radical SAM/Cys-rich protein